MLPAYAALLLWLKVAARHHGYALLVHGSGTRDLDLVAVPWVADAVSASEMVEVLRQIAHGDYPTVQRPQMGYWKPHGRRAFVVLLWDERPDGQMMYLDISVLPRMEEL